MHKQPSLSPADHGADSNAFAPSEFIKERVALLLQRFSISYTVYSNRIEYNLLRKEDDEDISFSLVFSLNTFARQLHVSKFYPELFRQPDSKYLSAAAFYLLIHHCAKQFALDKSYSISLQCRRPVFAEFYSSLPDFSFEVSRDINGENVEVSSPYRPSSIITTRITPAPND